MNQLHEDIPLYSARRCQALVSAEDADWAESTEFLHPTFTAPGEEAGVQIGSRLWKIRGSLRCKARTLRRVFSFLSSASGLLYCLPVV